MKNCYNYQVADCKAIMLNSGKTEQSARLKAIFSIILLILVLLFTQSMRSQVNFYTFVNSASGNSFETITSPTVLTTTVGGTFDNDYNLISPAGFTFKFGTTDYTQFTVSTNGWVRLGNTAPPTVSGSLSQTGIDGIYAFTRDGNMNIANGGNLTHGPAAGGKYVFQLVKLSGFNVPSATSYADAQIVLWGSTSASPGRIDIIYGPSSTTPGSQFRAGIGDNQGRTYDGIGGIVNGSTLSSSWLAEGRMFTFTPPPPCITPSVQATSMTFNGTGFGSTNIGYTAAAGVAGYLTVRYLSGATPTNPVDGTNYTQNNILGNGVVVNMTTATGVSAFNLSGNTTYDFYVYTYNTNCLGGPVYNTVNPLMGSRATNAGTLSGIRTIGAGGNYTSLSAAFSAIASSGLNGPMELQLIAGYPATAETFPMAGSLNSGVLNDYPLKIYPTVSGLSIASSAGAAVLIMQGVKNVTIDGRVNQTGPMDLVISTTSISAAPVIQFNSDASNNTIKYCNIKSANNSTSSGTIYFTSGAVSGCDNNVIDHCDISDSSALPVNAIYSFSGNTTGLENNANIISNNNIYNYYNPGGTSAGINLVNNNNNWTITGNRFFQQANRTATATALNQAIQTSGGMGYTITDNIIGFADALGTGTTQFIGNASARFIGMNLTFGAFGNSPNLIQNNTISGVSINTTGGNYNGGASFPTLGGIVVSSSGTATAVTTISGNTIGAADGTGALSLVSSCSVINYITGINYTASISGHQPSILNNTVSSITATSTIANVGCSFTGINLNTSGSTIDITGNNIGSNNTANAISLGTAAHSTAMYTFYGIDVATGSLSCTKSNNTVKNVTILASSANVYGIRQFLTSSSTTNGNTISTISMQSSVAPAIASSTQFYGLYSNGALPADNYANNVVEHLSANVNNTLTTTMTGIFQDISAEANKTSVNNMVNDLLFTNTTTATGILTGIHTRRSGTHSGNKVSGIVSNTGTNSTATGMNFDLATNITASNNLVANIAAPSSGNNGTGMSFSNSVTNANVYYNTIYMAAAASGANTGSYGLYSATTTLLDMRNNIIVNKSAVTGTGRAIAFMRSTSSLATYSTLSNNNLLYAGTPGTSRMVYGDQASNTEMTLATYKVRMNPREKFSRSQEPLFLSTDPTQADFLHISPADSSVEGGGTPVSGFTTDYDGNTRNATTPDIGADEGNFAPYVLENRRIVVTATSGVLYGQYQTLAEAIFAINNGDHAGTIVCSIDAGHTETAPLGGYVITATGTAGNPITFTKAGVGADPVFTAYSPQFTNNPNDAVIKIVGGDYITLDRLTLQENSANTGTANMTEFGVALYYATATDGAQHCTIKNCTIDLTGTYNNTFGIYSNSGHTSTNAGTLASATGTSGGNSFLTITGNTITDVNYGIMVSGPSAATDWNDGLVIGGSAQNANTITAFGVGSPNLYANITLTGAAGIYVKNTKNYTISYNTFSSNINNNSITRGVWIASPNNATTDTMSNTISNNSISIKNNNSNNSLEGILLESNTGSATSALTIDGNSFNDFAFATASSASVSFIRNVSASYATTSISNNTFGNNNLNVTVGNVVLINNTALTTTVSSINGNTTTGTIAKASGTGTFTGITSNGTGTINNNTLTNIVVPGGMSFTGITIAPASLQLININNNTVSNVTGLLSNGIYNGIVIANASAGSSVNGNTITSGVGGSVSGISLGTTLPFNGDCLGNTVGALTASNGFVYGINLVNTPSANIGGNKIYDLQSTLSTGTVVGLQFSSTVSATSVYNNLIGGLRNDVANAANAVIGINFATGTSSNMYNNTVYLNASSSGALFGSNALFANQTPTLTLRNNILVNASTPTGGGLAAAYRRSGNTVATYVTSSDNNLFYGSTLFTDGTSTFNAASMDNYRGTLYPRDASSVSANPVFLSTNGASVDFLHISPADNTGIESGGTPIAGLTVDFDGNTRNADAPDIGSDEGNFIALAMPVHVTSTTGQFLTKNYRTLAAAVAAINAGVNHTGTINCTIDSGYSEMAPQGGYVITATGTAVNPITFTKTGAGSNPVFTAYNLPVAGIITDAVFKIIGGDYITLDHLTILENSNSNTTLATNNMTEFGVVLYYASVTDGAQHCSIKNCTIDLNTLYSNSTGIYSNSCHNATALTTLASATGTTGGNSFLTITGNTITDVNHPILINGPTAATDWNDGLIIGGSAQDANIITAFGAVGASSSYANINGNTIDGIYVRNTKNFTISYNTINSNSNISTTVHGIWITSANNATTDTMSNTISNNSLSLKTNNNAAGIDGIGLDSNTGSATSTLTMNGNSFNDCGGMIASTGIATFLRNGSASYATVNINNNTFGNNNLNMGNSSTIISNNALATTVCNISGNITTGTITKSAGTGGFTAISTNSGGTISNNIFTNLSMAGSAGFFIGINAGPSPAQVITANNNVISNVTGLPSSTSFAGMQISNAAAGSSVNGNTITAINGGSNVIGISLAPATSFAGDCIGNTVGSLLNGNGNVFGISAVFMASGNIGGNKVYDLQSILSTGIVTGILANASSATGISVYNNLVGDLRNTVSNSSNGIIGMSIGGNAANPVNVSNNTVYLNAGSSGATFGSSAMSASTTPVITTRNNILVNTSTTTGAGLAVAYRRSNVSPSTYGTLSDNNLFYASTLFNDFSNNYASMELYRARSYPREASSFTANPNFLSTDGTSPNFLHINSADNSGIESGGVPIAGLTVDYDGNARNAITPDIGADEGSFISVPMAVHVTSTTGQFPTRNYMTLAAAVSAINNGIFHTGTIVCTVDGGYTETAPPAGYVITATGTATNPITFTKGAGANPVFTGFSPQTTAEIHNAVFKISGSDYVTIDGFKMVENPANTNLVVASNNMTEYGVMVVPASITDGAQNCTIKNCIIDLDKNYASSIGIYSNATVGTNNTSITTVAASGSNSNLAIKGNAITDVNTGIVVLGGTNDASANDGLIIGGTVQDANTITDFGTVSMSVVNSYNVGGINGIVIRNVKNFTISYNTINTDGTATNTTRGIYIAQNGFTLTGPITDHIDHNNLSARLAIPTGTTNEGIIFDTGAANATATVTMDNNDFSNYGNTGAGQIAVTFIKNNAVADNFSISGNTFSNIALNTSVATILINNTTVSYNNCTMNNNAIIGTFTNAGIGSFTGISHSASTYGPTTANNNNFSNMTFTNGTSFTGMNMIPSQLQQQIVDNNVISNINGVTGFFIGINVANSSSGSRIKGNTVQNVAGTTGATTGISANNILGSTILDCYDNNVNSLSSNNINGVVGISLGTAQLYNVYNNRVYNLVNNSSSNGVTGITIGGGVTDNVYNNRISDLRAPQFSAINAVSGMIINAPGTANIYHNTIYLNGSSSATNFGSAAINILNSNMLLDMRNNILVNTSPSLGTGFSAAFKRNSNATFYSSTSDNNLLYGTAIYNDGGTITDLTLSAFKNRFSPRESHSISEVPVFLSTDGSSPTYLHIDPSSTTGIESGGNFITGYGLDVDGDARNTTYPDIGADEGTFTGNDTVGPMITYTPLSNMSTTANPTFSGVIITDISGVNTTTAKPRLYYKKSTDANTLAAWKYVEASNTTSPYSFTINYAALNAGSAGFNDIIQYFIVAEDLDSTPAASINYGLPAAAITGVNLNSTHFPINGTLNSFQILPVLSGVKTVCPSGCDYSNLTLVNGAFDAINRSTVNGNITLNIAGDLLSETGAIRLNQFVSPHTLTIKPVGSARTIAGNNNFALIALNGADNVTIDGSLSTGNNTVCPSATASRDLTIMNSNSSVNSAVIWLFNVISTTNGATNNTVRNCIVSGNGTTTTYVGIGSGGGSVGSSSLGTACHNNAYINNDIRNVQVGIFTQGLSYGVPNTGTVISQNIINGGGPGQFPVRIAGIYAGFEKNITMTGNRIANVDGTGTAAMGISLGNLAASSNNLTGNEVSNATITNNIIDNIRVSAGNFTAGIFVSTANNSSGTILIANNSISNTFGRGADSGFGIVSGGGAVTTNVYHNTVNMSGNATGGTYPNFAFAILGSQSVANIRNNIFINSAVNGAGTANGIGAYVMAFTSTSLINSNNNVLFASGSEAKFIKIGQFNNFGGTEYATLAAYRTTANRDLQSINADVTFISATDLRPSISTTSNAAIASAGMDSSAIIPTDIDCATRSTMPSIGFKEFYVCGPLAGGTATGTTPSMATPQATISVTGYTTGTTILYQWQSSQDPTFIIGVSDIGTASTTYTNLILTTFPSTLSYRLKVTCTNGGVIAYSNAVEVPMLPPGNCLTFDGVNDFVTADPTVQLETFGTFTVEAWVKPMHPTKNMHIFNTRTDGDQSFDIQLDAGNLIHGDIGDGSTWLTTTANANYEYKVGTWLHIAYVVNPSTYTIYANGEVVGSGTFSGTPLLFNGNHDLELGVDSTYGTYFDGSIDEVKVYKSWRTQAEVKMDMVSTTTNDPANLIMYYNFDSGISGSNNAGINVIKDKSVYVTNANLSGFALNGNTSNWMESYAMVVPTIQQATNISTSGFTANWTAPATGTVEGYLLDVATSNTFSAGSMVSGYNGLAVSGTSQAVTGIGAGIYYYRVRANKSSVNAQGAYSAASGEIEVPMTAPGNALIFDGSEILLINDSTLGNFGTGPFTIEFNLRTTSQFTSILNKRDICAHTNFFDIGVFDGKFQIEIDQDASATNYLAKHGDIIVNDGRWHHVAVTRNVAGLFSIYVDGVLDVTGSAAGITNINNSSPIRFSAQTCAGFTGSIDEFRIWSVARTQAEIQSARLSVLTLPQTGLSAYYHFDSGVASGLNTAVTTLKDYSGNNHSGTLFGFDLNGSTSNWVESYAMVVAGMAPVTNKVFSGFTANWTAPTTGTVDSYMLDVSTSPTFASFAPGYNALPVTGTSAVVSGLDGGTYYYRVRPNKTSVNNQAPYTANSEAILVPLLPPGNALLFDGTNDYVNYASPPNIPVGNSPYTLEAWIYPTTMGSGGIIAYGNYGTAKQVNALRLSGNGIVNYWWSTDLTVTTGDLTGRWHHVAATFDGTTRRIYLDGAIVAQDTPTGHNVPNANNLTIGTSNNQSEFFRGKIDEARVWNVALSQAQIQANMTTGVNPSAAPGMVLYHNFDKGSLVNSNAGITSLPDHVGTSTGTLQNFNFSATSNWVESYAMVIPQIQPATGITSNKFTANWSAPTTGITNSYLLDVSTSSTFATYLPGYQGSAVSATFKEVTGLSNGTYYYRVYAKKTGLADRSAVSAVSLPIIIGGTTTWNGTAWSNGVPNASMAAIIAGPYSSSGSLEALNLTINNNAVVTINSGHNLTIDGPLTVTTGTITFENNANLVQTAIATNTGSITIKRNTSMRRLDYTYWSSPVSGQNLKLFSPNTMSPPNYTSRFYIINETTNAFDAVNPLITNFAPAVGYSIRAPNDYPTTPMPFTGIFTGVPFNGNINIPVTNTNQGFNLIGNPYPSTIDAMAFLNQNTTIGTLYFWTHTAQEAASGANYATCNRTGVTAASVTTPQSAIPNGKIQIGQGFMVKTNAGTTVNFLNSMRVANNDNQFFRTADEEKHRIWLNLANSINSMNQILVGYVPEATDGFDFNYDGKLIETAGSKLYNVINDEKYVIQGRALPFDDTDVVPLGFITETPGSFTISLDHVDGLFSDADVAGQDIFLKDNVTGTTYNIKQGPYTFVSDAGTFNNRFEVVYQSAPLVVENPVLNPEQIILYKENGLLHVNTGTITMQSIRIFDIRGRLIYEKANVNTTSAILNDFNAEQQVLIVKITSDDGKEATKRIVY